MAAWHWYFKLNFEAKNVVILLAKIQLQNRNDTEKTHEILLAEKGNPVYCHKYDRCKWWGCQGTSLVENEFQDAGK